MWFKRPSAQQDLSKIVVELDSRAWHLSSTESFWAKLAAGAADLFILNNIPFFAKGLNYLDVVQTDKADGVRWIQSVVKRSGHSTYRLIVEPCTSVFGQRWKEIEDLGCTYESGSLTNGRTLYAVDVPPTADIHQIYSLFEDGERDKVWIFEEGSVGHPSFQ